jgi:hypothetical protein
MTHPFRAKVEVSVHSDSFSFKVIVESSHLLPRLSVASLSTRHTSVGVPILLLQGASETASKMRKYTIKDVTFRLKGLEIRRLVSTHLLFNLQLVHDRRQLRQDLVGLLVVFELGSDQIGKVSERLGSVEDLGSISVCLTS